MEFDVSLEPLARRDILRFGGAALTLASPAWLSAVADAQTVASGIANREHVNERATVAEDVARWIVDLRYEDLPANVIARAERVLLDTVGCALGAIGAEPVPAPIWVLIWRYYCGTAAFSTQAFPSLRAAC
jgi:hypothetical protein